MFSHRTFQTQMPCVIEPLVTAAVSEMSRLLVQCSAMESLVEAAVTEMSSLLGRWLSLTQQNEQEESQVSLLLEGTRQLNKAMTSHFTSLMETWSKAAVGKISVLKLSMDEGESASAAKKRTRLDDTTTQKRVKPKTGWTGAPKEHEDQSEVDMDEDDALLQGEEDMWLDLARAAMAVPAPGKQPPVKRKRGRPPKNTPKPPPPNSVPAPNELLDVERTPGRPLRGTPKPPPPKSGSVATTKPSTIWDVQQQLVCEEEFPPEQQERTPSLDPEPPHIKEEWEEVCISQFPFTPVHILKEDVEEKPQSSHLHQTENNREAGGEDCGIFKPARNLHPASHLQPTSDGTTSDSSETDDSEDWNETREPRSRLESEKNSQVHVRQRTSQTREKHFSCSHCGQSFVYYADFKTHMEIHAKQKLFSCSLCGKMFAWNEALRRSMLIHTGGNPYPCSVCKNVFAHEAALLKVTKDHTGDKTFSSEVSPSALDKSALDKSCRQSQTENRETEPLASCSTQQIKTEADGEDWGVSEPARNLYPSSHLQPTSYDKTSDSSETDDSDDWNETREPQSGLDAQEKQFICSLCSESFDYIAQLKIHMRVHTAETIQSFRLS